MEEISLGLETIGRSKQPRRESSLPETKTLEDLDAVFSMLSRRVVTGFRGVMVVSTILTLEGPVCTET